MSQAPSLSAIAWAPVRPSLAKALTDARLQAHHCVQFASAFGISYLTPASDDSHTALSWDAGRGALMSGTVAGVSLGVRLMDLVLLVVRTGAPDVELPTHAHTIDELHEAIRLALATASLAPDRYTLRRHFEIPAHPVATGGRFDASDLAAFNEIARWFGNAAGLLTTTAELHHGSAVACWPHHFDIATLITVGPGRTTGAGLAAGDGYYDEPYFYVNAYPRPAVASLADTLAGGGHWHTHEWIGAVLPGSVIAEAAESQQEQARAFLDTGLSSLRALPPPAED